MLCPVHTDIQYHWQLYPLPWPILKIQPLGQHVTRAGRLRHEKGICQGARVWQRQQLLNLVPLITSVFLCTRKDRSSTLLSRLPAANA